VTESDPHRGTKPSESRHPPTVASVWRWLHTSVPVDDQLCNDPDRVEDDHYRFRQRPTG
jgi:hypothetical protein